ncbi:MAG: FliM/FliN family flagellar motor switch protein [Sphingomonas sp.]
MPAFDEIDLEISVVLGATSLPIRQVLKMSRGAMIAFDSDHDAPVKIYTNDTLVAHGNVLVNGDRISVEVTDVVGGNPSA